MANDSTYGVGIIIIINNYKKNLLVNSGEY